MINRPYLKRDVYMSAGKTFKFNIRHKDFRRPPPPSRSGYRPWILKWAELFTDLISAVNLLTILKFVASIFGTPLFIRMHGNPYLFLVVTSLEYIETI